MLVEAKSVHDRQPLWSEEIQDRLRKWAAWARGNQLIKGAQNVLAAEIQRAAGESPGTDLSVPYDLTFELEVTEKAIAQFRLEADEQEKRRKKYMKKARRVLMSTYLGNRGTWEIAEKLDTSEDHVKQLLWYAESYIGRLVPDVEKRLNDRDSSDTIRPV